MRTNIKQHTVPQLYLRNFTNKDGVLFALDTETNKIFETATTTITTEKYAYYVEKDKKYDVSFDAINQWVESFCGHLIFDLPNLINTKSELKNDHWRAIWLLTANLIARNRRTRDKTLDNISKIKKAVQDNEDLFFAKLPEKVSSIFNFKDFSIKDTIESLERASQLYYPLMVALTGNIAKELSSKRCELIVAPPHSFITSDDPIVLIDEERLVNVDIEEGFIAKNSVDVYLSLSDIITCRWGQVTPFAVRQIKGDGEKNKINNWIRSSAYRQIYAVKKEQLQEYNA